MDVAVPRLLVANADFVTARLAVGGDLDHDQVLAARQAEDLLASGITHVLDVRYEASDEDVWSGTGVTYRWSGIDDAGQQVPPEWFEDVVAWVLEALADPGSRVLTHCHMGINRGPSVGFAVLLALGRDPVEAIDAIRRARPIAHVWYAEDALHWHHDRSSAGWVQRRHDQRRLERWRREHPLDVVRIVREQRESGR